MLNADEPVVDVASGDPLLGEQTQKKVTPSGTMGKDRPQAHDFSKLDVQNSIPRALTRPSVGIEGTYHDMRWAYAFTANVIGTIVTALLFGHSALKRMSLAEIFPSIIYSAHEAPHDLEWIPAFFLGLGLVLLVIGFAMGVLHSFANRAQLVVWSTIFLVALVWLLAILLIAGFKWTGLAEVLALIFFIAALVIFNLRARFRLGAAVLKSARKNNAAASSPAIASEVTSSGEGILGHSGRSMPLKLSTRGRFIATFPKLTETREGWHVHFWGVVCRHRRCTPCKAGIPTKFVSW